MARPITQVLARQETVLETINLFFTQTHESQAERFRTMGLKELKDLALSQLTFKDVNPPSIGLSMWGEVRDRSNNWNNFYWDNANWNWS